MIQKFRKSNKEKEESYRLNDKKREQPFICYN